MEGIVPLANMSEEEEDQCMELSVVGWEWPLGYPFILKWKSLDPYSVVFRPRQN